MEFSKLALNISVLIAAQALFGCLSPNGKSKVAADSLVSDDGQYDSSATFYVDSVRGGETAGIATNSWGFPEKKIFNFSVCLRDIAAMSPIIDQPFSITDGEGVAKCVTGGKSGGACRTDASGCLVWQETHSFDYLAPETFLPMTRIVKAEGVHSGSVRMNLALDPWRSGGDSLVDLRINSVPQLSVSKVSTFSSKLEIPHEPAAATLDVQSLNFQFLGMDASNYRVDRRLTLSVAHSYRLRMSPTIYRKGLSQDQISEYPSRGKMRVTLVLLRQLKPGASPDPKDVLAQVQKELEFQGGTAVGDVTLEFQDLAALTTRAYALLEVEPIIESPSIGPARYEGPIGPLPSASAAQLVRTSFSAVALRNTLLAEQSPPAELSNVQILEKYSGMKPLSVTAAEAQELLGFAKLDPLRQEAILRDFCNTVYPKGNGSLADDFSGLLGASISRRSHESPRAYCLRSPLSALKILDRDLVENVNSPTPARVGVAQTESLNVAVSFSKSVVDTLSTGNSTNLSLSGNASAGVSADTSSVAPQSPFSAKVGLSVSYGAQLFRATSHTKSTTASASITDTHVLSLSAESNTFAIDVTTRPCAVLVADSGEKGFRDDQEFPGYFVCSGSTQRKNVLETYYLVTQTNRVQGSPFSDPNDAGEMPFQLFIRGDGAYSRFKTQVSDPATELLLENPPKISQSLLPDGLDLRMTQEFPGMLSGTGNE